MATKAPWPSLDGGRLLLAETLRGLERRGVEIVLVVPTKDGALAERPPDSRIRLVGVASTPVPLAVALLRSLLGGPPIALARHRHRRLDRRIAELLASGDFDLVWVEQLQAIGDVFRHPLPVVLRQQNVESSLWEQLSEVRSFPLRQLARRESRRLGAAETTALRKSTQVLTLSRDDADALHELAGGAPPLRVHAPPFPSALPPGPDVAGDPALVVSGSRGWWPNEEGLRWFLRSIWPALFSVFPRAVLHVYGLGKPMRAPRLAWHPPPQDSRVAFPANGILLVPLLHGSGVRIKILEAWSRGLPVVATPLAAAGLAAEDGRNLLLASTVDDFVHALSSLADGRWKASLREQGRATLRRDHDPEKLAEDLLEMVTDCLSRPRRST